MYSILIIATNDKLEEYKSNIHQLGYTIHLASSSTDSINKIKTIFPDMILQDIEFPDYSQGLHLLKQIKAKPLLKDIPIITIGSIRDKDVIFTILRCGAIDYLLKPFNPTILRNRLHKVSRHIDAMRTLKTNGKTGELLIRRSGWLTIFSIPGILNTNHVNSFHKIYTDHFRKITLHDYYVFDLRNQPTLDSTQTLIVIALKDLITDKEPIFVAGKRFQTLSEDPQLASIHITETMEEAEKIAHKNN